MRIKGGPELRARLANVVADVGAYERAWATDAARLIRADAPTRTGALKGSIREGEKAGKGIVTGNWYGIIQDRGTKSYPITPKGSGTLRFEYRGRTIFAKKVQRKRLRRRPFITRGAQEALRSSGIRDAIMKAWSRKSGKGRFSKFGV